MTKKPAYYSHQDADLKDLYRMFSYCRPHDSQTERDFVHKFLIPLDVELDAFGNVYKRIGNNPEIAWSSHIDTVHRAEGFQHLEIYDSKELRLTKDSKSSCLGADDTAGVWLMHQMIKAEKPGLYIFHRGEECGGKGSRWIVRENPALVTGIKTMIALDRRGYKSVITHQVGSRCASNEFGASLADALNINGDHDFFKYDKDEGGSFTDSANYTDLIGECTNLSVGYEGAHGARETQHLNFLCLLRHTLIKLDPAKLVIKRAPGEKEAPKWQRKTSGRWEHGKWVEDYDWSEYDYGGAYGYNGPEKKANVAVLNGAKKDGSKLRRYRKCFRNEAGRKVEDTVFDLIKDYPAEVATILEEWGFEAIDIRDMIKDKLKGNNSPRGWEHVQYEKAPVAGQADQDKDKDGASGSVAH